MKWQPIPFLSCFLAALLAFSAHAAPDAPPVAPAATPASNDAPKPVAIISVADEIKARGSVRKPGADVIPFDGPMGNGRVGAKGVLLKNDPETGKTGSTWFFTYTRAGTAYAAQIIHPLGAGQVIVHLKKDGIGISRPVDWTEVGWSGGSSTLVKMFRASAEIFPLQDGEAYEVESRLSGTGGLEVTINGKLVATAQLANASPLSLEIPAGKKFPLSGRGDLAFKGADFPLQWTAGYAGLIMAPLDGGASLCRDVRFKPSAVSEWLSCSP